MVTAWAPSASRLGPCSGPRATSAWPDDAGHGPAISSKVQQPPHRRDSASPAQPVSGDFTLAREFKRQLAVPGARIGGITSAFSRGVKHSGRPWWMDRTGGYPRCLGPDQKRLAPGSTLIPADKTPPNGEPFPEELRKSHALRRRSDDRRRGDTHTWHHLRLRPLRATPDRHPASQGAGAEGGIGARRQPPRGARCG
jgi:hypothetical protein